MKTPSLADLRHKISVNTLELESTSANKERKTHRDIRPEDKEAYDLQAEFLAGSPRNLHGIKWVLVVLALTSLSCMLGLDYTTTANIQATSARTFQSVQKLAFNSAAFFLGAGATVLTWRQIYSLFSGKWTVMASILIFEVGNAVSGAAPSINSLIIGRALAGVGGGGMYLGVWTILSMSTTEKERDLYTLLSTVACGLGTTLGPIIGGAFAQSAGTWRWGYYIQLCIGACSALLLLILLPSKNPQPTANLRSQIKSIDIPGSLMLVGASTTLTLAINLGGLTYPWKSGSVIALWIISGLLSAAFCFQQVMGWLTQQKLFPAGISPKVKMTAFFLLQSCSVTAFFITCYFVPLYFQYIKEERPLASGVHLLPLVVPMSVTAIICDQILRKNGYWQPSLLIGGVLVLTGGALMYTVDAYTDIGKVYGYSILIGVGAGAYIHLPFTVFQTIVSPALAPSAAAFMALAQLATPAVTLSIAYALFLNMVQGEVTKLLPVDQTYRALNVVVGVDWQGIDVRSRHEIAHVIAHNLAKVYILVITSGMIMVLVSAGLTWRHIGRSRA